MKLSLLAAELNITKGFEENEVTFLTDNSAKVCPGCIFVCIKGRKFDGHTKAAEALEKGAAAVVTERDMGLNNQLLVENARNAYTRLCAAFFAHPEKKLKLIGITGTNGKTTTAFVIKSAMENLGKKIGMLGTVKNSVGDGIDRPASLTTPDPYDLFGLLAEMVKNNCEYCVMEVSSQALDQHRVDGIRYAVSVFTNLTRDHLDYHGSFENYMTAKHKLFENSDISVINIDDEAGEYMMENTGSKNVTFSVENNYCDYSAKDIRISPAGVKYEIVSNDDIGRVSFNVPGRFSVYNSMGAVICLLQLGFDLKSVLEAVATCSGVPGRMEIVPVEKPYTVIIDYAHTPDGLENVLTSLREITDGKIFAIFGCGGDRDKTKRPLMGEIGARLADVAIITSDNPRSEDPDSIIEDVVAGIPKHHSSKIIVECDRTKAIAKALSSAGEGDVVLLAGKGHETYQILASGKIDYDERNVVRKILGEVQ